jgi:hypothetical protein
MRSKRQLAIYLALVLGGALLPTGNVNAAAGDINVTLVYTNGSALPACPPDTITVQVYDSSSKALLCPPLTTSNGKVTVNVYSYTIPIPKYVTLVFSRAGTNIREVDCLYPKESTAQNITVTIPM